MTLPTQIFHTNTTVVINGYYYIISPYRALSNATKYKSFLPQTLTSHQLLSSIEHGMYGVIIHSPLISLQSNVISLPWAYMHKIYDSHETGVVGQENWNKNSLFIDCSLKGLEQWPYQSPDIWTKKAAPDHKWSPLESQILQHENRSQQTWWMNTRLPEKLNGDAAVPVSHLHVSFEEDIVELYGWKWKLMGRAGRERSLAEWKYVKKKVYYSFTTAKVPAPHSASMLIGIIRQV